MTDIKFEIIKKIGILSKSEKGWAKELYGLTEEEIGIVDGNALTVWLFYR